MAEEKVKLPLLGEELGEVELAQLTQVTHMPGYRVIVKMLDAACLRATQDLIKLDPESENYKDRVAARTARARCWTEFSDLVLGSIAYHAQATKEAAVEALRVQQEEHVKENIFGIHPAKPGDTNDAITKTFGIHAAKPVKKSNPEKA